MRGYKKLRKFRAMVEYGYLAFALGLATAMSVRGYRKRSLSADGAALAFVVGVVSCAASVRFGLTLIAFFLGSSRVTKIGAERKKKIEDGHQVGGNRNWVQVAANGGLGTLLAAVYWWRTRRAGLHPEAPLAFAAAPAESLLQAAYLCHYAACNADTWASELGVLAVAPPRLATRPWRQVPPGTNGGVTAAGTAASVAGGLLIGLVFVGVGAAMAPAAAAGGPPHPPQWPLLLLSAAAGGAGSLIDSILGATLQYSGWCERKRMVVERPSATIRHICGYDVLDNHQVNALASAATSALGAYAAARWLA